MVHDRHPKIEDDLFPRPRDDELTDPVDDGSYEQDHDQDDDELVEKPGLLETEVEDPLHDLRPHQTERGGDDEKRGREREVPAVRADESEEPSVHRDRWSLLRHVTALAPHEHVDAASAHRAHHFLYTLADGIRGAATLCRNTRFRCTRP